MNRLSLTRIVDSQQYQPVSVAFFRNHYSNAQIVTCWATPLTMGRKLRAMFTLRIEPRLVLIRSYAARAHRTAIRLGLHVAGLREPYRRLSCHPRYRTPSARFRSQQQSLSNSLNATRCRPPVSLPSLDGGHPSIKECGLHPVGLIGGGKPGPSGLLALRRSTVEQFLCFVSGTYSGYCWPCPPLDRRRSESVRINRHPNTQLRKQSL